MIKHDTITELYYRMSFGMRGVISYLTHSLTCSSVGRASDKRVGPLVVERSLVRFQPCPAHSQIHSSMRIGSSLVAGNTVSSLLHSFGGTIEPKTTNNYPKISQFKFLSHWACMISIVLGRFLGLFAAKNILTLKTHKILSNGSPFHLRPMVT